MAMLRSVTAIRTARRVPITTTAINLRRASTTTPALKDNLPYRSYILRGLAIGLASYLFAHLLYGYVLEYAPCHGVSMVPTFASSGDWVLISRYHRRGRGIKVGDIISYAHPIRQGERAIKRIVGMEGDFVLRDTPPGGMGEGVESSEMMVQVPVGHCWIASDNLRHGYDSRHYGPLPLALVKGKVLARCQPWWRPRWFGEGLVDSDEESGVD